MRVDPPSCAAPKSHPPSAVGVTVKQRRGFARHPHAINVDRRLTPLARNLIDELLYFARDRRQCYPSNCRLATSLDRSETTVKRSLKLLVDSGYIAIHRVRACTANPTGRIIELLWIDQPDAGGNERPRAGKKPDAGANVSRRQSTPPQAKNAPTPGSSMRQPPGSFMAPKEELKSSREEIENSPKKPSHSRPTNTAGKPPSPQVVPDHQSPRRSEREAIRVEVEAASVADAGKPVPSSPAEQAPKPDPEPPRRRFRRLTAVDPELAARALADGDPAALVEAGRKARAAARAWTPPPPPEADASCWISYTGSGNAVPSAPTEAARRLAAEIGDHPRAFNQALRACRDVFEGRRPPEELLTPLVKLRKAVTQGHVRSRPAYYWKSVANFREEATPPTKTTPQSRGGR